MVRKPCVSGRFYPDDPAALRLAVNKFLAGGPKEKAKALIAPHAGYIYSGAVAGSVYASAVLPESLILIGPNHTGLGARASIMPEGSWETPLGAVGINRELAGLLLDSSPLFSKDRAAHLMEHSLEVQLPFIRSINENASIVPITIMHASLDECLGMGKAIAGAISAYNKDTLIIVSSDMNHYEPDEKTREKDSLAIEKILNLDARGLHDVTSRMDITMCGVIPAVTVIVAAKILGAKGARLIKYSTSGETSGDLTHVVGYAGILIK